MINPQGIDVEKSPEKEDQGYYSKDIADGLPEMMIFLIFLFSSLVAGGIYFMKRVKRKVQINISMLYS